MSVLYQRGHAHYGLDIAAASVSPVVHSATAHVVIMEGLPKIYTNNVLKIGKVGILRSIKI